MVAFGGQGIALDCFPSIAVFPPRQTLSPHTVESVAIAPNNQYLEQIAMIYQFLCVNRNATPYLEEIVQVQAINEDEARWQLTAQHALLATVGRYPDNQTQQATDRTARLNARLLAKFRPNHTAWEVVYA
ncbi:hypothetical protein B0187_05000 [Haemophilus paracuniculus]|uniref:Uncharacterized protein n=1 Tax=Haemophilus paracuniculus TaxID=734 RepID=A0A1T0ASJ8_9PAST|nr:hypothetical protein [Haemophilus paracuniculus]OOR99451.1 hypothetical protein B0187_05000 [Haemophilus paracuniculus]